MAALLGLQITRWPGVHWNTLRSHQMPDSATAQCSGEMGHRIRAEHQRNPVVSRREACRTGIGYPANHTARCREKFGQKLEKEPEGTSRVARDRERVKRARREEQARDMRVEDPEQQPLKELARPALVVVLEMNRLQVSVMTSLHKNRVMMQT